MSVELPDVIPSEATFCPEHEDVFQAFMTLLPPGTAWDNVERSHNKDSVIRQFMSGLALGWLPFEAAMCESLDEWFCIQADIDLDLWALDYGLPDSCDIYNTNLCAKVSATGPPTEEFLLNLLAANGYTAEGRWLAGDDPEFPGVRSTFWVVVDPFISPAFQLSTVLPFPLGEGYMLGNAAVDGLACMLERAIPAHCAIEIEVAGSFTPTALGAKLKLWWSADDTVDGPVTTWLDRIGTPLGADQMGAAQKPMSAVDAAGYRYLTFDGVDDFLRTALTTKAPSGTASSQMWALFKQNAQTGDPRVIMQYSDNVDSRRIGTRLVGTQQQFAVGTHDASVLEELVDEDMANIVTDVVVAGGSFLNGSPDRVAGRVYGRAVVPASLNLAAPLDTPTSRAITIGADGAVTTGGFAPVSIRHLLITDELTPHEAAQLEGWLAWDVDRADVLDGSHTYRNIRP